MPTELQLDYDVVVIGGGMAGLTAALSAGQNGSRTVLVERHPFCGGAFTAGMVLHVAGLVDHRRLVREDDPSVLNSEKWIVQGLAREYHRRLTQFGAAHGPQWDTEPAKIIFDRMLKDYGVDVLYGTQFFSANVKDGRIIHIEAVFRTTRIQIKGKMYIDATGDGDLGAEAGVAYHFGRERDGAMMPGTLSYMVADVHAPSRASIDELNEQLQHAWEQGLVPKNMRPGIIGPRYSEERLRQEVWCSPVRQWGNFTDPVTYSRMEQQGREIGWEVFRYLKNNSKAMKDSYLSAMGPQIWPREGRHFQTEYILTANDVRRSARFDDVIARGVFYLDIHSVTPGSAGWDLDEHRPEMDSYFEIPYRALVPKGVDNLLLAGRTIGADHEGHSATRVMGTGIATGQAAGLAVSLALKHSCIPREIDIILLQNALRGQGVVI